jgi:hypothetical protein
LDADLERPRTRHTNEEHALREELDREIAEIRARGSTVNIPFGLPELG